MRFNVAQLLQEPTGAVRWHEVHEAAVAWDGLRVRELAGGLKLTRTDLGVWVSGRVTAETTAECSRCLAPVAEALAIEVDEQFYPLSNGGAGESIAAPLLEDDAFGIGADNELDVGEACRQNLLTQRSFQPLCRDDCAGLCPDCGANRNEAACGCGAETIDPRWAGLQALMRETAEGTERG